MVSVASTSAYMDLTAVVPASMEGIAQEVGVEMGELKVILVGDETQIDVKPFQTLKEQFRQVEWQFQKIIQPLYPVKPTMEPHLEIRCKQETQVFQPFQLDYKPRPSDVRLAERWTNGESPVDLYQVGTFGTCLSSLRSRTIWPTQGNFIAKGAPRYWQVSLFSGGARLSVTYPEEWAQSPLPIETFLRIQTWHTRYPQFHKDYSLEFNVTYTNVVGLVFEVDTLSAINGVWIPHRLQIMHKSTSLVCVVFMRTTIGDMCPNTVIQTTHIVNFHQDRSVQNQFPKHHDWSSHQRKRPLSRSLNRTLLTLHPSGLKKIARDKKILTSLRSATSMNCGATNGRTFFEQ